MKEINTNINVIGGGLIGLACAFSLLELGYKVTILEKKTKHNPKKNNSDKRTIAISEGTKQFLDQIGIWKYLIQHTEPIKNIKIIDRSPINILDFDNYRRNSNLGYIIKNRKIIDIFYQKLSKYNNLKIFNNINIQDITNNGSKVITGTNNYKIISDINIAADGKNSFVRKYLKTSFKYKTYNKKALVLTFSHSLSHNKTAYEFFFDNGPFAILPMQKDNNKNMSSIVWTNDNDYLDELLKLDEQKIIFELNKVVEPYIGRITNVYDKQLFPISAHINDKFYFKRNIYVGDSAHTVHPIAGQGWNLGMRDVKKLFNLAQKYKHLGIEIGSNMFCKEYHDSRYFDAFRLYQITDKLDGLFKNKNFFIYSTRMIGLNFIQKNKKVKNLISDFAMGI